MKLFWNKTAKTRSVLFRSLCVDIITGAQKDRWPSCMDIVMREIDVSIRQSESDFASFAPDYNYEELALNVIKNITFELISTGHYNVSTGVLKPIGRQLVEVCMQSAYRAMNRGYLSQQDYRDFIDSVYESIETMG